MGSDTNLTLQSLPSIISSLCCVIFIFIFSSAVEPADFVALLKNITFSPGDREICQDISILDDTLYEEDESFSALLNTGDSSADIDQGQQSTTIIIMDTDGKQISYSSILKLACTCHTVALGVCIM